MKIEIEALKKVKIEKGDTIIVYYDDSFADFDISGQEIQKVFPENKILFMHKSLKMEVMKND